MHITKVKGGTRQAGQYTHTNMQPSCPQNDFGCADDATAAERKGRGTFFSSVVRREQGRREEKLNDLIDYLFEEL